MAHLGNKHLHAHLATKPSWWQRPWLPLAVLAPVFVLAAVLTNGHYDTGDSLMHYLYARHAPQHPELFLNHWAKPFFVLVASPWAQFGFVGVKLFNALLGVGAAAISVRIAQRLSFRLAGWMPVLCLLAPEFILVHFSGLTEPLFALLLCLGLWLHLRGNGLWAGLAIGLLPFVRSEGMIVQLLFGLVWLAQLRWKALLVLPWGYVAYGLVGALCFAKPLLWYFTDNPYAGNAPQYGTGHWLHFLEKLPNLLGLPGAALFLLGSLVLLVQGVRHVRQARSADWQNRYVLLLGGAWALLLAHSYFWAMGGYKSFGMLRVLVATLPLMALVSLWGTEWLQQTLPRKLGGGVLVLVLVYVLVFPFAPNPAALKLPAHFQPNPQLQVMAGWASIIPPEARLWSTTPAAYVALNRDPWQVSESTLYPPLSKIEPGDWLVWDAWFGPVECQLHLAALQTDDRFEQMANEPLQGSQHIVLFRRRP